MKVSVCVTVYNEEDSVGKLLESLVHQSRKPDEIVIVDSKSTDSTEEIIKRFKSKHNFKNIKLIVEKCSRAEGRNLSIKHAKHNIIVMTDAGCVAKKDWLENITNSFSETSTKVVAGFYDMTGERSIQKSAKVFLGVLPEQFNENFLPSTRSIAFRRCVWKEVGGFPEKLDDTAEDTVFNLRLLNYNVKILCVKDARVEWVMPTHFKEIAHKMYSYAKGDARAGVVKFPSKGISSHNIKVILKLLRYIFFILLLILGLRMNYIFIFLLVFLLLLYSLYSFYKVFKKTGIIFAGLWGIVLQYTSDLTGIWGFVVGYLENLFRTKKKIANDKSGSIIFKVQMYFKYVYQILINEINLMRGQKIVYCLGDSHMTIFEKIEKSNNFKNTHFNVFAIGGATAMGMGNPLSKTKAYKRFRRFLKYMNRESNILIGLGEVDCGFVIWYRKDKYKTSVKKQLDYALKRYQGFLKEIQRLGYKNIIVLSAQPPTIMDGRDKGEVANLRVGVKAGLKKRSDLTAKFNKSMKKFCKSVNIKFLDLTSELVDSNGIVKKQFLNENIYNHHVNTSSTIPILIRLLREKSFE